MRRWLIAGAVLVLLAVALVAQPPAPKVYWQHDGANLTHFTCQIDSGTVQNLTGLVTKSGANYSTALSNCGTLSTGSHLLYIAACNDTECTTAAAIHLVKL